MRTVRGVWKGGAGWWWYGMKRGRSDSEARPTIQQTVILCHVRRYLRNATICLCEQLLWVLKGVNSESATRAGCSRDVQGVYRGRQSETRCLRVATVRSSVPTQRMVQIF